MVNNLLSVILSLLCNLAMVYQFESFIARHTHCQESQPLNCSPQANWLASAGTIPTSGLPRDLEDQKQRC